jgi:muramoyltetrapeptide carboxypeptidase LdcA involved in peptidoglycan recycling
MSGEVGHGSRDRPRISRRLTAGDRVAVLSPSWAVPAQFPMVHEQALRRLRQEFQLEPVEFPTTRRASTPAERAADINAAFADPTIRGILATIGGDDQIAVLHHLDPVLAQADPKLFVGYSDNVNLLNWLWFHGVEGVHGGSTQVHLGPSPRPDHQHLTSLRAALFGGEVELTAPGRSRDVGLRWDDPDVLNASPPDQPAEPWQWVGSGQVSGSTWGGCLEIVHWTMAVSRWLRPAADYVGCVLLLETDEELKPPEAIYRMLRNLGERGLLSGAAALVWGRPPVGDQWGSPEPAAAAARRAEYRDVVLRAVAEYQPDLPVVLDVDFGHTSPQWVLPYGGILDLDFDRERMVARFE